MSNKTSYKISANGFVFNKNINVDLNQMFDFTRDEDLSIFSDQEMEKNINPVIDREYKRFKNITDIPFNFTFTISGYTDYVPYIFTNSDIVNNKNSFINSFWILDYYDSTDKNTQTKLYTNFYRPERIILSNNNIDSIIRIPIDGISDSSVISLPNNVVSSSGLTSCFIKFRFFNAKNGIIYNFKKDPIDQNNTSGDYFFKISIDNVNKSWYLADVVNNRYNNYVNPTTNNTNNPDVNPTIKVADNKDKGSFINTTGKYQDGSTVDNNNC